MNARIQGLPSTEGGVQNVRDPLICWAVSKLGLCNEDFSNQKGRDLMSVQKASNHSVSRTIVNFYKAQRPQTIRDDTGHPEMLFF